jgi:class 3 adenylate cyclase
MQNLDMRIGIHTGRVVAGIIGSKLVRYDVFGEGVIIAKAVERHGVVGKVCISEYTWKILLSQPDVASEYIVQDHTIL